MSNKTKALRKPRLFTPGGVVLFVLGFIALSIGLGLLITLLFTGGFGEVKVQIKQVFDAFGLMPVWDFLKRAVVWITGLF